MNKLAQEIAQLLDRDPIMASQIQEHLTPERLREVLDLRNVQSHSVQNNDGGWHSSINEALECVVAEVPLSDVIAAYKRRGGLHG